MIILFSKMLYLDFFLLYILLLFVFNFYSYIMKFEIVDNM